MTSTPTVLIAEDVRPLRISLERMVSSLGFETLVAADGEEALRAYGLNNPAIALLDIAMPGVDGIEVCRRIRLHHPEATVIMLTANSDEQTVLRAVEAGAVDYLTKPVTLERLETALRAHAPASAA